MAFFRWENPFSFLVSQWITKNYSYEATIDHVLGSHFPLWPGGPVFGQGFQVPGRLAKIYCRGAGRSLCYRKGKLQRPLSPNTQGNSKSPVPENSQPWLSVTRYEKVEYRLSDPSLFVGYPDGNIQRHPQWSGRHRIWRPKRQELSTSVSSVSSKEITATPVADAAQAPTRPGIRRHHRSKQWCSGRNRRYRHPDQGISSLDRNQ